jgi:hypothetical protein
MDVSDQRQVTELLAQLAAISAVLRAIANSPTRVAAYSTRSLTKPPAFVERSMDR